MIYGSPVCLPCFQQSVPCFPAAVDKCVSLTQPCLALLQALRASPLAWLRRLARLVPCGPLSELLGWAGLPLYSPLSCFSLAIAWLICLVQMILLVTRGSSGASKFFFLITVTLIADAVLVAKDDVDKRRADIAMLAAAAEEAERKAQQVPEGLQSLRNVLTTFGASATAAAELAQQALDGVTRTIHQLVRLMHPGG